MSLSSLPYSLFTNKFKKKRTPYEAVDGQVFELYKKKVSEEFALFMKEEGFCSYLDGLFTTVNPITYKVVMEEFRMNVDMVMPLLKNGFGDIIFFDGVSTRILYASYNEKHVLGSPSDAVKMLYAMRITEADFQNAFLKKKLFNKAVKEYGGLAPDETFGFVPAIPLGGEEKLEHIEKVKTLEYLSILSQSF
jgi:hypothetical protein